MATKLVKRGVLAGIIMAALSSTAFAQSGPRQFYSDWAPHGPGQMISKYYYKPNAGDSGYHFQYVVHRNSSPNLVWFFNANNQYWCAAPTDPAKNNQWHVFSSQQTGTISQAQSRGLPTLQGPPTIPGATDPEPMLFPTNLSALPTRR